VAGLSRNIEWLLREGARDNPVRVGGRTVIASENLRAVIECVDLGEGLRVYLTDATATRDVTVEPRAERAGAWIGSQTTIAGRARIDFLDGTHAEADAGNALLFRAARRAAAYKLDAGSRFLSAGYGLDVERVERLFDGAAPAALRPLLAHDVASSCVMSQRLDRQMRAAAKALFARRLNGPLRTLMMEGAVIQLLALQAAAMAAAPAGTVTLTRREQGKVREARKLLLSDMRNPPSLGALAQMVALSEKKLNAGFRIAFGATVYETLRNERLEHARLVLAQGQLSLKDVAQRVGYNHVSNFINAFTARYGAPPRRFLRAQ
jgi:AraC-like DNA-binding protein